MGADFKEFGPVFFAVEDLVSISLRIHCGQLVVQICCTFRLLTLLWVSTALLTLLWVKCNNHRSRAHHRLVKDSVPILPVSQFRPDLLHLPTTNDEHCTSDVIKMNETIGAKTIDLEWAHVHPTDL